jgi:hypothetical protein
VNKKAMVKSKIEKAQGFTLSIKAATATKGKSNFPAVADTPQCIRSNFGKTEIAN